MAEADWAGLDLPVVALKYAMRELERGVEEEGDNWGPSVQGYLEAAEISVPAPWCAAAVQWCAEKAAMLKGVANPLEAVEHEAYVPSYVDWAEASQKIVNPSALGPGDLFCLYHRGKGRYAHMGFVREPPFDGWEYVTVEGNSNTDGSREGTRWVEKKRPVNETTLFIRWSED